MRAFFGFLSVVLFLFCFSAYGQAPPGINYQAVARDKDGKALVSKDISVRVSILHDGENGDSEYVETHTLKTNPFGLFMLVIGRGDVISGDFNFISWAVGNKWLKIELDPAGGNFFQMMGSQQLMSVPYAFYAKYSGNGYIAGPGISINNSTITNTGDTDKDPANELISQLTFGSDNKLRITEAGTTKEADLSSLVGAGQSLDMVLTQGNDADGKTITNLGSPVLDTDAATKEYVDNHEDGDASDKNEIQDLKLAGNTLTATKNTTATAIDLTPFLDNTDSQALTLTGQSLSISGGNSVNLSTLNTDAQTLSLAGPNLSISGGNSIDLSSVDTDQQNLNLISTGTQRTVGINNGTGITLDVADNDNSVTNEIQDLALSGNQLSITNNASPTSINLAPYLDNTDQQDLSLTGNTLSLTNDATAVNLALYLDNTDNQNLSLTGNTLSLTNDATTVSLASYLDNTDAQTISTQSVDANTRSIAITGGNTLNVDVRDADASITNEIQDLSLTSNTLSLTNDATAVSLAPYLDNTDAQTISTQSVDADTRSIAITGGNTLNVDVRDADASITNEIQNLSLSTNTLSLSGSTPTINLAPYLDNTDAQTLSYNSATKALSVTGGNSVTITETQTLSQVLTQGASAGSQQITNLAAPTANNDAATKKYVDDADAILNSKITTTYAFKTAFSFVNGTILAVNDAVIPFTTEDFDDFNVLATNSFTANENGVYTFTVDGSYSALASGGTLSFLYNGVKHPIAILQPWGGIVARYNATIMLKMTAGQTVTLVGDNVLVGGTFTGTFFGYKL